MMTYVDALTVAINTVTDPEAKEKLTNLRTQYAKKRTSVNSKAKAEATERAEKVYKALSEMDKPVTLTELAKLTSDEEVASYTNQRLTALCARLEDEHKVKREEIKRKAYYSII